MITILLIKLINKIFIKKKIDMKIEYFDYYYYYNNNDYNYFFN